MIDFNINQTVLVKLTEEGLAIHRQLHDNLNASLLKLNSNAEPRTYTPPVIDDEGFTRMQLWALMRNYGPHIALAARLPIEATIKLDPKS